MEQSLNGVPVPTLRGLHLAAKQACRERRIQATEARSKSLAYFIIPFVKHPVSGL
jgi:hypothetical protein